jgi:hypothetical protein
MYRFEEKLERIRSGQYRSGDFIVADAKDADMAFGVPSTGPARQKDGTSTRFRTRAEFIEMAQAIVEQDDVDIMLTSTSTMERMVECGTYRSSKIKPAIRANDATDVWLMRGADYSSKLSRPFRSTNLSRAMWGSATPKLGEPIVGTDLGLYSLTFNNDIDADIASLEAFAVFRAEAAALGFSYFLEVFNPNVPTGIAPEILPHYINDCIQRCLAGLTSAERPLFLKVAYNGPKALEEMISYDPSLVIGVLGGAAGTTRDCFELIAQAEQYGARVALFGRKINFAESPLAMVAYIRAVADGKLTPSDAVKAYHGTLQSEQIKPYRDLAADNEITDATLKLRER